MKITSVCVAVIVVILIGGFLLTRGAVVDEVYSAVAKCADAKAQLDGFVGSPQEIWNLYSVTCK